MMVTREFRFSQHIRRMLRPDTNPAALWHYSQALAIEAGAESLAIEAGAESLADRAALSYAFARHGYRFRYFASPWAKEIPFRGYLLPRSMFERQFIIARAE